MVVSRKHQSTEFSSPPILTLGWPQAPCQVVLWQQQHHHDRGRAGQDHLPWQHRVVQDEEAGSGPSLDQHKPGQLVPNQAQHQLHHTQDNNQASLAVFSELEIWHNNSRLTFTLITMWATPGTVFTNPSLGLSITVCREVVFPTNLLYCRAMVWAMPGAVFSNISLGVSITVFREVGFPN